MGQDLVHLATASSQSEAAALRAYLEAHGIHAYLQGEHHSSLLGPMGAFFIELRILVPEPEWAGATELLEAFHAAEPLDENADVGEAWADEDRDEEGENLMAAQGTTIRPSRAAALAILPGFGLGHIFTGATGRGLALMGLEAFGIALVLGGDLASGLATALSAVALDFFGAAKRASEQAHPRMPAARLRSGESGGRRGETLPRRSP